MQPNPLPSPVFLNVEFIFSWLLSHFSLSNIFGFIYFLASILLLIAIAALFYSMIRLSEIKKDEQKKNHDSKKDNISKVNTDLPGAFVYEEENETWLNIRSKLLSDNMSDWRLAIIEADIYLDRLLDKEGIMGDTLGDKLKALTPQKLSSLQNAWEAHKVRNRIAHEGADFNLTMPEARKVLANYEIVFRDLNAIK